MKGISMLKAAVAGALLALAGTAFAQSTPSQTPSVTPSQAPSVTPSQTPSVTPSQTPSVTPSQAPSAVGGLSRCENLIGIERDKCTQAERAGTGSTGTGAGTMGSQNSAPSGTTR